MDLLRLKSHKLNMRLNLWEKRVSAYKSVPERENRRDAKLVAPPFSISLRMEDNFLIGNGVRLSQLRHFPI